MGAVCSLARLGRIQYSARLEVVSPDVRECCLFSSQTAPQGRDRFLQTLSSDTNHPHRVFDERGGWIALRHYSRSISMCHYSRKLPANGKLWQSITANNRRLSERRFHVKNHRADDMAQGVICFVELGYGHGNCSVDVYSAITGLCTKLLSGCIAGIETTIWTYTHIWEILLVGTRESSADVETCRSSCRKPR